MALYAIVLATAALVSAGGLALAVGKLSNDVRELRAGLFSRSPSGIDPIDFESSELANPSKGRLLLVVSDHCSVCRERAADFDAHPPESNSVERLILASEDSWDGFSVDVVVNPAEIGRLGLQVTPTLIAIAPNGRLLLRTVVGSRQTLDEAISAATGALLSHAQTDKQAA